MHLLAYACRGARLLGRYRAWVLDAQILCNLLNVVVELAVLLSQVRWLDPVDFALSNIRGALGDRHALGHNISTRVRNVHHVLHAVVQRLGLVSGNRPLAFLELASA